jgi:FG-GAP-like repeat
MPGFRWHVGIGTRSRAGISVRNPFAILAAVVLIGAATGPTFSGATPRPVAIWLMNGGTIKQAFTLATVSTAWTIVGVGDFDFDNRTDILWRHSNGTLAVWRIDGSGLLSPTPVKEAATLGTVPAEWKVAGLGDFDGDGRFDILWRHDAGGLALWLMDGTSVRQGIGLGTVAADWNIAGIGDFDGDCKADILWRQNTGAVGVWLMNGGTVKSAVNVGTVPTDWQIVGVGDYDGDRKADILWRRNTGAVAVWLMNVGAIKSAVGVGTVPTDWQVVK